MRRILWLAGIVLVLAAVMVSAVTWGKASATPKLGLDLEGGTSIVLAPQLTGGQVINSEQLDQAVAIIRQRVDSTGVGEAQISTQGQNIVVNLPGTPDDQTRQLIRASAQLRFRPVLVQGAPGPTDPNAANPTDGSSPSTTIDPDVLKQIEQLNKGTASAPATPEAPASGGGNATPDSAQGSAPPSAPASTPPSAPAAADSASAPAPADTPSTKPTGPSDLAWITDSVAAKYYALDCTDPKNRVGGGGDDPNTALVACEQDGSSKLILGPVEVEGKDVKDATFGYVTGSNGTQTNTPAVNLSFNAEGTDKFREVTTRLTSQQPPLNQFAIVLDGLVISAPVSQAIINDGNAQISGSFTQQSATVLANQLKNGALPIAFKVQTEESISPTLGSDYLAKGLLAGFIGLLLVVVYSLLQYRMLGFVTVASLVVAGLLTYLLLLFVSWRYGYRLSLAGVAGVIVAIGMTADSFIVYFERVRDELRTGRALISAVEVGWKRAERTIYASKSVNLLAAIVLYVLAVGTVQGFAFTLGLTVIVDVLVVILFTHPMLQLLARTKFFGGGHTLSGLDPRRLGVKKAQYRGALNLDAGGPAEKKPAPKRGAAGEAARRMTIAERRAAAAAAERDGTAKRSPDEETTTTKVSSSSSKES